MWRKLIGLGIAAGLVAAAWLLAVGTPSVSGRPDHIWGQRGVQPGDLARPRAATIDGAGRLWIVDFTARVQGYDLDGHHLGFTWITPDFRNGRPSGLGTDRDGNLVVCDSHYHCIRVYSPEGTELRKFGGERGTGPGQFGYISDAIQDADGFWYVSEFSLTDRITKLTPDGAFVKCWGETGGGPLQFNRVRAMALGPDGNLYAADACNHRIQVFTRDGVFVREFGKPGPAVGELSYPYDVCFGPGGELYVAERGNNRVQKFTADGTSLGCWGTAGRGPGELAEPWALVVDKFGRVHVIDTENHRVQRLRF